MSFKVSRTEAIEELNKFIENNLLEYPKLRNFDFGPQGRNNTSCLSPYVTHGLVSEIEIINQSLKKILSSKMRSLFKRYYGEFIGKDGLN